MNWISKQPPIYVFIGDFWLRETDKKIFRANLEKQCWECEDISIPFSNKTKIIKD